MNLYGIGYAIGDDLEQAQVWANSPEDAEFKLEDRLDCTVHILYVNQF